MVISKEMHSHPSYEVEIPATLGRKPIEICNLLYSAVCIKKPPPINCFILPHKINITLFAYFKSLCNVVAVDFRYSLFKRCVTSQKKRILNKASREGHLCPVCIPFAAPNPSE